jgi:hypothetical protein
VGKSGGELQKEGKVSLLPGGKRGASFGNGSDKGFVVGELGEQTTLKEEAEVADGKVGC